MKNKANRFLYKIGSLIAEGIFRDDQNHNFEIKRHFITIKNVKEDYKNQCFEGCDVKIQMIGEIIDKTNDPITRDELISFYKILNYIKNNINTYDEPLLKVIYFYVVYKRSY